VSCSMTLLLVRKLLDLVGIGPTPDEKDVEIAVLRHQLAVLRLRWRDRASPLPIVSCWRGSRDSFLGSLGPPSPLRPQP
jgi:hypothetical protein